ncbi:MAG: CbiX/SirB N-terminal domain-containing protein [Gemmataceae bacterium]|nr:CbiX/SirB N-terminal domain-containing protein [Gemmataceae bacterium]
MKTALLLMAHGSRNREANADLDHVAEQLRGGEYEPVIASFLELAEPSIVEGGRRCCEAGAGRVVMLPYFLSAGVHFRRDLQGIRDQMAAEFPQCEFVLAEPMGRHPGLLQIVLERAAQATGS